jgi:hypothetical protein
MFKRILLKLFDGFIQGTGFTLFFILFGIPAFILFSDYSLYNLKTKLEDVGVFTKPAPQIELEVPVTVSRNFPLSHIAIPEEYKKIYVKDTVELTAALNEANKKGMTAIILDNGTYQLDQTIYINKPHIMIRSFSANPYDVVLEGIGMRKTRSVNNILRINADYFTIFGITLTSTPNHLIQIAGELGASFTTVSNCILQDAYEQLLKVSYDQERDRDTYSKAGIVEYSIFQYTRGIAPNYYTGGIDALGAKDWQVNNNVFRDIASPREHVAQHAVHFWVNSSNNKVVNNIFIDNDRAIGFGLKMASNTNSTLLYNNKGGEIKSNIIYHSDNDDPFGDTGIILEASQDTKVIDNIVYMEHDYSRAIEYRYKETVHVLISNNQTNKNISSRDNGQATLDGNSENLDKSEFILLLSQKLKNMQVNDLAMLLKNIDS